MLLSAFTPCGFLMLKGGPSLAETIYNALIASLGGNYDVSRGSRMDGWCYALAMQLAEVRLTMIHAGLQISPPCVTEMMADREQEYGIVPGPYDTLETRRLVLAARELLPRGARREAVVDALSTLLGVSFVWYRTTKPAEIDTWPARLGAQPMNLQLGSVPRKRIVITQPISIGLGAPQSVSYVLADAGEPAVLIGDHIVIQPEMIARTETVVVTAVTSTHFTATFNNVHDDGSTGTTAPFPMWESNQRHDVIIVAPSVAVDPEWRRKINEILERILRAVSTWAIVATSGPGVAGPFILGTSPIGATPFGTVMYP